MKQHNNEWHTPESIAKLYIDEELTKKNNELSNVSASSVISWIPEIILFIEKNFSSLLGKDKQFVVIAICRTILLQFVENEQDKLMLAQYINSEDIKNTINSIVAIGNDLNTFGRVIIKTKCFGLCGKKTVKKSALKIKK